MKMRKWFVAVMAFVFAPLAALAEGSTVPAAVTTAVSDLETAASDYAAEILPYIVNVGKAFLGIAALYLLFRVIRRFIGGRG